jgi:hypothetical protein
MFIHITDKKVRDTKLEELPRDEIVSLSVDNWHLSAPDDKSWWKNNQGQFLKLKLTNENRTDWRGDNCYHEYVETLDHYEFNFNLDTSTGNIVDSPELQIFHGRRPRAHQEHSVMAREFASGHKVKELFSPKKKG